MAPANTQGKQQLPAAHPNLRAYVDTANACLKAWARANRQDWEGLTNRHALLLQALLEKSKPEGKRGAVQIIPLQELKNLFADELTGRKWEEFLGWYEREIEYSLKKTCAERKEEVLYPGRSSSGNGGRGEKGKAIYFLSFDRPVRAAKPRRKRDTAVTGTAAQGDGQPIADIPPTDSNASASSRVSKEPPSDNEVDGAGAKPDGREPRLRSDRPSQQLDLSLPLGVYLSMPSADRGGSPAGWALAMALIFGVAGAAAPASTPLADEILRVLAAAREALSGAVIVRF